MAEAREIESTRTSFRCGRGKIAGCASVGTRASEINKCGASQNENGGGGRFRRGGPTQNGARSAERRSGAFGGPNAAVRSAAPADWRCVRGRFARRILCGVWTGTETTCGDEKFRCDLRE